MVLFLRFLCMPLGNFRTHGGKLFLQIEAAEIKNMPNIQYNGR